MINAGQALFDMRYIRQTGAECDFRGLFDTGTLETTQAWFVIFLQKPDRLSSFISQCDKGVPSVKVKRVKTLYIKWLILSQKTNSNEYFKS